MEADICPLCLCSKTTQRNKQIAMGRKKFNMDPKKVQSDLGLNMSTWGKS